MKRVTVSLPDEIADRLKELAGGTGQVSAYVGAALAQYEQRESLADILADWERETPIPDSLRRQVDAELTELGMPEQIT